jgi:hypothetical protein
MSPFSEWENFYVIIGSSAAGLTGLQFVVIALIADQEVASTSREIDAFGTPTIVHFGVVLLLSGILSAPWHGMGWPALLLAACGVAGLMYSSFVVRRATRQTSYHMVLEDWIFFALLPILAHGILMAAGLTLRSHPERALFGVAITSLLLLFVGIHNAWDTVTFIAVSRREADEAKKKASEQSPPP